MNEIQQARIKFEELHHAAKMKRVRKTDREKEAEEFAFLAAAAEVSWRKAEEYFKKADDTPAYYTAISLNPTLKHEWYNEAWPDEDKRLWIPAVTNLVREFWLEEYKGKYSVEHFRASDSISRPALSTPPKEKAFAAVKNHKRLKIRGDPQTQPETPAVDLFDQFVETDVIQLGEDESFDPVQYWNDRYHTQRDLAQMALDVLAVTAMSDECERLFSSAKILLSDRRCRLKMDIIEASECLRAWYGRPARKSFDDDAIGAMEGELPANGEEGKEAEDTGNADDGDVEDEPQILDGGEADEDSDEENTAAGTVGKDDEIC